MTQRFYTIYIQQQPYMARLAGKSAWIALERA